MKNHLLLFLFTCVVYCVGWSASESPLSQVSVYHVKVSGGKAQTSPSSPQGVSILRDKFDVLEQSLAIPLLKEHGVAVAFKLNGDQAKLSSIHLVVTHPKMVDPSGVVYAKIERDQKTMRVDNDTMVHFSYAFDEPWELVEGAWIVQIFDGKRLIGEAQFLAVPPTTLPNKSL